MASATALVPTNRAFQLWELKKKSKIGHISALIQGAAAFVEVKCSSAVYLELEALFLASFCRLYEEEPAPPASEDSTFSFFSVEGSRWSILP